MKISIVEEIGLSADCLVLFEKLISCNIFRPRAKCSGVRTLGASTAGEFQPVLVTDIKIAVDAIKRNFE